MELSREQLDWVVAEVVRRLRAADIDGGCAESPRGGELAVDERVVTVATLQRRLAGIACVRVPRGAVVTPAVRDLLRERNIALVREV